MYIYIYDKLRVNGNDIFINNFNLLLSLLNVFRKSNLLKKNYYFNMKKLFFWIWKCKFDEIMK